MATQDLATAQMIRNIIDGTTPVEQATNATNATNAQTAQKVVARYEQLADGTYNLIIGIEEDNQ